MPFNVLIRDMASAPASSTAEAIPLRSVTLGLNLTITGKVVTALVAEVTRAASLGSVPNSIPPAEIFGQLIFSSMPLTPGTPSNLLATATYSSTVSPATLTITGTCHSAHSGAFSLIRASTPIFSRPTELSRPSVVSTSRGCSFPLLGLSVVPLQTMAPNFCISTISAYSVP